MTAKGYRFFSQGDTEVILKAYAEWGPRCVERFYGMFAFALWERNSGRVVLARDRLGIKPLYYAEQPGRFRFASSLPALLAAGDIDATIDPVALHHYMSWHAVVPAPMTIIKGVRKLAPATICIIEPDGRRREEVYWRIEVGPRAEDRRLTEADWREAIRLNLGKAVERRRVADVPVGVLLSGGLDSSILVAMLAAQGQNDLKTFSVGFEKVGDVEGDEFRYSDLVAQRFRTDHHRIKVDASRDDRCAAWNGRRHVGADDEPRCRRLLHAVPGSFEIREGGAERAGRRRDFRWLSLVSGAAALERSGGGLCAGLFRPRPR